jgi:hypothetical protein
MNKHRLVSLAVLAIGVGVIGCGGNPHAPARVSGKVTYNGKPVTGGSMAFVTPDGNSYPAQLGSDGTYTATDLPAGELVVIIDTESLNPAKKPPAGSDAEKRMKYQMQKPPPGVADQPRPEQFYVKIPEKYSNPKTSPLTVTLTSGRQVHNFELTD